MALERPVPMGCRGSNLTKISAIVCASICSCSSTDDRGRINNSIFYQQLGIQLKLVEGSKEEDRLI